MGRTTSSTVYSFMSASKLSAGARSMSSLGASRIMYTTPNSATGTPIHEISNMPSGRRSSRAPEALVSSPCTPVAAVLAGEAIANRIDELLATHGLADIPDTAAALTPPLPAEPDYCRNCGGRNDNHWAGCQST